MGVPGFGDIGKDAKDLLYGGKAGSFNFDQKLKIASTAADGVSFTVNAVKKTDKIDGDMKASFKVNGVNVDTTVTSGGKLSVSSAIPNISPGLKATVSGSVPGIESSGKLALDYVMDHATFKSSFGLTASPAIDAAVTVGNGSTLFVGGEGGYSMASSAITKWSAGLGYLGGGYSAGVTITDKGDTLKGVYWHKISDTSSAGAEVVHKLGSSSTAFAVGYSTVLDNKALFKFKLQNNGLCSLLYEQSLDSKAKVTLCSQFDATKMDSSAPKLGMSWALSS